MSNPAGLATLAAVLRPFADAVLKGARRLYAEREAGQLPLDPQANLLEGVLDETLNRLRGRNVEEAWWRKILNRFGQKYVAPDFLRKPALQEWLTKEQVGTDFKTLATAFLLTVDKDESEARIRLTKSYSDQTGEASRFAAGPIDVVLAILVDGCIASIPSDQQASTGIIQAGFKHTGARFDRIEALLTQRTPDPTTQKAHTGEANTELSRILRLRAIDPSGSRTDIQDLLNRTRDGDLRAADPQAKAEALYWAARLCSAEPETLSTGQQLREELGQIKPEMDLTIVDALIAEAYGSADEALRIVRDRDDPDSRSAFFSILSRSKGEQVALEWWEQQDACGSPQFFTGIGWINWAIFSTKLGRWEEAVEQLIKVAALWSEAPALAFLEGRINAAMLLPDEYRGRVFDDVPLYTGINTSQGTKAANYHARAATCLDFVSATLADFADQRFLKKAVADWRRWLRIIDPDSQKAQCARDEIRCCMNDGPQAVDLIPFASVFNIPFDMEPLKRHLDQRRRFGGLGDQELLAESLLFQKSMSPRDFSDYLERHRPRLHEVLNPVHLTTMQIDALVRDGQTQRARTLIDTYGDDLDEGQANRLNLLIDTQEGTDPRSGLEHLYHETKSLVDLRNLVSHLKSVNDRAALGPLLLELFGRERTIENALDAVRCVGDPSRFDHESVLEFLKANVDLVARSDDLNGVKAWALFQAGRLEEAKAINDGLLNRRTNQDDFHLDISIAISLGHWENVEAAIDREWPRRDSHNPEALIRLAFLSGQRRQAPDRALQLARLAAEKAPEDPGILAAAYWLYFKLGRDQEADSNWLMRASELSSSDEGPLWRVDLKDIVNDLFPKRRGLVQEVERRWLAGEIPMYMAASVFNVPLARFLFHTAGQNAKESDGRKRMMLPIISGGRAPTELQESWTIGLDVASVMVLAHLDLLEQALGAFHHVKLAPDLMELLFRERDETRFHQPSRIEAAMEVQKLENTGQVQVASDLITHPPDVLVNEVGFELATLLRMAERDDGVVVCVLPIYRLGSLMEQSADTGGHDRLIISTADVCNLLNEKGKIDAEDHRRAMLFFSRQGQTQRSDLTQSSLDGPVYVEDSALSYLQDAGILQSVAASGLDVRVHPNVLDHRHALIEEGDIGHKLGARIEQIRTVLRNAVDNGAASFLPRAADRDKRVPKRGFHFQATRSLLAYGTACDALCVDDRYINNRANFTGDANQLVPIVCVLDVLRHLPSQGVIDPAGHWTARHKLRRAGFAFLDVDADELVHWLKSARVVQGQMTESAELKTLRQAVKRADSLGVLSVKETMALSRNFNLAGKTAIARLWEDSSLTAEWAGTLSDWVWHNLMKTTVLALERFSGDNRETWIRDKISLRLGYLLLPATIWTVGKRLPVLPMD